MGDKLTGLLTLEEVARTLKVSKAAVYRWTETGRLRGHKVGSLLRFRPEDIENFLVKTGK